MEIDFPKNWSKPVYDFKKNPLIKSKVELGRKLFYDPILSLDGTISCSSCHLSYTGFTHVDHALSHGIGDRIGRRNSPALINLAWNTSFMWDGAINNIEVQGIAPIEHPDEMGEKLSHVIEKLQQTSAYPALFFNAFGDSVITGQHFLKALSQFQLTLVSCNSKYDRVMKGKETFTEQEQKGYQLFKNKCATCHPEPLFTNGRFENNGLPLDTNLKDYGRMEISMNENDAQKFKVPTLRNVQFTFPYMHDGRFKKLSEVVAHYNHGIEDNKTLSKDLAIPMNLTLENQVEIISFLLTLTDKSFLFNPDFAYPRK
ncbi:MAG: c-type cytochrome [Flavobacteriales bacterium]|nr:c-type cytochrome [Flavobacteriales bacterium]